MEILSCNYEDKNLKQYDLDLQSLVVKIGISPQLENMILFSLNQVLIFLNSCFYIKKKNLRKKISISVWIL